MNKKVIFQIRLKKKNTLVLLNVVYSRTLPQTLNSAESGHLYSKQNIQPSGFLTVSTSLSTLGDTILNSSCPYDCNHSSF